ncbi:MAG: L,D-transpeptidase [Cyanobacteria bacterium J06598_1]
MSFNRFKLFKLFNRAAYSATLATLALGTTLTMDGEQPAFAASPHEASSRIAQLKTSTHRWIEVNLNNQQVMAWEGNRMVYNAPVSSGIEEHPTREGSFAIQSMHITASMRGEDYDLSDVPYTMYYSGHYALHGTYWHQNFGQPTSHGCINLSLEAANWLFSWAHVGTPVVIH